jgi:hypothetical protein
MTVQDNIRAFFTAYLALPTYEERVAYIDANSANIFAQVENYDEIDWNTMPVEAVVKFTFEATTRIRGRFDTSQRIIFSIVRNINPTAENRQAFEYVDEFRNFTFFERLICRRRFKSLILKTYLDRFQPQALRRGGINRNTQLNLLRNVFNHIAEHMCDYMNHETFDDEGRYFKHLAWKFIHLYNYVHRTLSDNDIRTMLYEPDAEGINAMQRFLSPQNQRLFEATNFKSVRLARSTLAKFSDEFKNRYPAV